MREAVGGTWLLYFFFTFVFIYIVFITIIMNYASAYRTNNYIVSYLENQEGQVNDWNVVKSNIKNKFGYLNDIGYCCSTSSSGNGGVVYRVETYLSFEWPLIGGTFKIPITNDSKPVYKGKCESYDSCNK